MRPDDDGLVVVPGTSQHQQQYTHNGWAVLP